MLLPARTGALARARTGRARRPPTLSAEAWILLAVTILAAVLRIVALGSQSYWLDESQAAHELSLPFGGMLHAWNTSEWNPPLYLIVAWPWAQLAGTGEVALRSLSALAGVAVVPLLYLSGRELVSRRAGLLAAGFAAVNPLMIGYSQQAREYMLMTALCTASLLCFARALHAPTGRRLAWWAAISALALLTQYFAGFLIAAEGLALVARARSRASVVALVSQAVVLAPLIPHVSPQLSRPAQFIVSQPLSLRLQQVPVAFALNTLYKGPLVSDGLLAAAALAAAVIALLVLGAADRELRGAGIAAALAAAVVLVPLALALAGRDDFIARGLMPAWPPLAVTIAAACTARRARLAGGALAAVLVALFLWGTVKIDGDAAYQNPDWRAVAAALGPARGTRVIVAYDGQFATGPLSYYLPRAPWAGPGSSAAAADRPVTITEIDVVGEQYDQRPRTLPAGVSLIAARAVGGYEVDRFALAAPRTTTPQAVLAGAGALLAPPVQGSAAMIQRAPA